MNFIPIKRDTNQHLSTNKLHNIRFHIKDFAHLLYEIAKLIIIICLFILVIRSPKVILFALVPALCFIVPALFIRLFAKLLSFILRIFV